jgi:large conductance mechanosensitive channel
MIHNNEHTNHVREVIAEDIKEYAGGVKGFLHEFREFAIKGNVIDLAVGVIIGGAFNKIISSLVADIIMPLLGLITGNTVKFDALKLTLREGVDGAQAITLNYGIFLQTALDFLIMAFVVFLMIKLINRVRRHHEQKMKQAEKVAPPAPSKEEVLLTEIRDILKQQKQS